LPRVVVAGGGVAGVSAALAARRMGAETVLLEASKRVGLSRALMPFAVLGGMKEDDLFLPEASTLAKEGVEVRTEEGVVEVDHRDRRVRTTRGWARFDALVLASGSTSQTPQMRGITKANVFCLRTPGDYLELSRALDGARRVAVSGPLPLSLKLGEVVSARGKMADVFCGEGALEQQFPRAVARRLGSASLERNVALVEGGVEAILGVRGAEAVLSRGAVHPCDCVVLIPRGAPSMPRVECDRGGHGGALVDQRMQTSLRSVFAAGDVAELRFKSGSVPARLYSAARVGGEVAGVNASGGNARAAFSWSLQQEYFGIECCAAGINQAEALGMGLESASAEGSFPCTDPAFGDERLAVSVVYDVRTHQVYGVRLAGRGAFAWSGAASLVVSLGLGLEQLLHVESPYAPGVNTGLSPIGLTAGQILAAKRAPDAEASSACL
jgi:NADPH-dependent 2,4-dienoyl-CoA reductase/sulfur reductase-like enzyme